MKIEPRIKAGNKKFPSDLHSGCFWHSPGPSWTRAVKTCCYVLVHKHTYANWKGEKQRAKNLRTGRTWSMVEAKSLKIKHKRLKKYISRLPRWLDGEKEDVVCLTQLQPHAARCGHWLSWYIMRYIYGNWGHWWNETGRTYPSSLRLSRQRSPVLHGPHRSSQPLP